MRPEILALLFRWLALGFACVLSFTFSLAAVPALSFGWRMATSRGQVGDHDGKITHREVHDVPE